MNTPCAHYGVASKVVHHGQIKHHILVLGPLIDHPHLVNSGDQEYADALCNRMRKAAAQCPVPNHERIYSVVPLPMTGGSDGDA